MSYVQLKSKPDWSKSKRMYKGPSAEAKLDGWFKIIMAGAFLMAVLAGSIKK